MLEQLETVTQQTMSAVQGLLPQKDTTEGELQVLEPVQAYQALLQLRNDVSNGILNSETQSELRQHLSGKEIEKISDLLESFSFQEAEALVNALLQQIEKEYRVEMSDEI